MFRLFEDEHIVRLCQKYCQSTPDFLAQEIVQWMQEEDVELDTAVDVGCGSGQNTLAFAPHFRRVRAYDISVQQIVEARRHPAPDNVSFQVAPAEKLPLRDHSVQLITGSCSFHWFDLEAFFAEVDRVLVPNGVAAAVCVYPGNTVVHDTKSAELNQMVEEFKLRHSVLMQHERMVKFCRNNYDDLPLPYPNQKRVLNLPLDVQGTLAYLLGSLTSKLAQKHQFKADPVAQLAVLDDFCQEFLNVLGFDRNTPPGEVDLTLHYDCSVVMCRKPSETTINYV